MSLHEINKKDSAFQPHQYPLPAPVVWGARPKRIPRFQISLVVLGTIGFLVTAGVFSTRASFQHLFSGVNVAGILGLGSPRVAGVTTQQVTPNPDCPVTLITEHPSDAQLLDFSQIVQGQQQTLPSGKYYLPSNQALLIAGQLIISGKVEIYASNITVTSTGVINASASGNNGGTGGKGVYDRQARKFTGTQATSGVGYCTNNQPGCTYEQNTLGGGGARSDYVNPDGAGGGGYGGNGGGGSNTTRAPGGKQNYDPPTVRAYNIRMGSGGGGGYCDDGGTSCRGGRGGGSISLYASNMTVSGTILANGQNAKNISYSSATPYVNAAGAGGSGGGILLSSRTMNVTGTLQARGGRGGDANCQAVTPGACDSDDDAGGGGAGGVIKIFIDPTAGNSVYPSGADLLAQNALKGGAHGSQVATNYPESGNGGFYDGSSCPPPEENACPTDFHFALTNYDQYPQPGSRVFIGGSVSAVDFQNKTVTVTHTLDPIEQIEDVALSYGDWHGVSFNANKGTYYKLCFQHRRGDWNFSGNSLVDWNDPNGGHFSVGVESFQPNYSEQIVKNNIVPSANGSWTQESLTFKADWPQNVASNLNYVYFRDGSFHDGWFTGSLDVDDIGVFPCGPNESDCQNPALSCDSGNIGDSSKNQIVNIAQDATFDSQVDVTSAWYHASAAPDPNAISTRRHVAPGANGVTDGYLQIRSSNYFSQGNSCPNGVCTWSGVIPGALADFQLYTISRIPAGNYCQYQFVHSGTGEVTGCQIVPDTVQSTFLGCPGEPPTATILGPFTVCQNQQVTFSGQASFPDPSVDQHQFQWTSTRGPLVNNEVFHPVTQRIVEGTLEDAGALGTFNLSLQVKNSAGQTVTDTKQVNVVQCNTQPSEDVHAGGRAALNPPPGTTDSKSQILKWFEIPGLLP